MTGLVDSNNGEWSRDSTGEVITEMRREEMTKKARNTTIYRYTSIYGLDHGMRSFRLLPI